MRRRLTTFSLVLLSLAVLSLSLYASSHYHLSPSFYSSLSSHSSHEHQSDPIPSSAALFDYTRFYSQASPKTKPVLFALYILWLIFLFAFVGITASDFFCPNLSTISTRLGMSESVAGVTFLAFSNGSPDVFSTFASLKQGSGSLAIGELLGAASFIVSVVAGTMCVIQPFTVPRHTFLRDVGFFTVAVTFTLAILWDSHIHGWEAAAMVGLYLVYVAIVAVGSWWEARSEKKQRRVRNARNEYAEEVDVGDVSPSAGRRAPQPQRYKDNPSPRSAPPPLTTVNLDTPEHAPNSYPFPTLSPTLDQYRHHHFELDSPSSAPSSPLLPSSTTPTPLERSRAQSHSHTHKRTKSRSSTVGGGSGATGNIRTSLLGAIEFRDVVNSLRADSNARSLSVFGTASEEDLAKGVGRGRAASLEGGKKSGFAGERRSPAILAATAAAFAGGPASAGGIAEIPRRVTWTGAGSVPSEGRWDDGDHQEEEEDDDDDGGSSTLRGPRSGAETPLIDLSAGVDDPWKGAVVRQSTSNPSLRLDVPAPPWPPSALRRTPSASSLRSGTSSQGQGQVPSIRLTTANGDSSTLTSPSIWTRIRQSRLGRSVKRVTWALFPSLQEWETKSFVGRVTAVLCVPAILALNLTLPVVENENYDEDGEECGESCEEVDEHGRRYYYRDDDASEDFEEEEGLLIDLSDGTTPSERRDARSKHDREAVAHRFHQAVVPEHQHQHHFDTGPNRVDACDQPSPWAGALDLDPPSVDEQLRNYEIAQQQQKRSSIGSENGTKGEEKEELLERKEEDKLTRSLTAVQCALGPVFCVSALFADALQWWYLAIAFAVGLGLSVFAYWCFEDRRHPGRIVLCFVGFFVAMVWILMIVNEVVGVLQTFGHIFGLSDAILGLTIFAMGNSLGDLVANATVARMGFSQMAIAACFASPLLNMLLGIGLSGSYIIIAQGGGPLHVEMGRTLIVSGVGLLVVLVATLIIVPLNGYWMSKKLGWGLIAAYVCVLSLNICVEIWL